MTTHNENKKKSQPRHFTTTIIMLFFPFLSTLLIFCSLSARAHPQGRPRATSQSPPPHIPGQPYRSDLVLAERRSSPSPLHSSGPIDTTTRRYFKRFIMDADYASSSSQPLWGKSSHKRADSLSSMTGTTEVGYGDIHEQFPPDLPTGFPST
jgi:hypothetical protein